MTVFLVLLISGLMYTLGSFRVEEKPGSAGVSLALGYLLLVAYFVGGLFKQVKLPKLTGYIGTGVVVGPALLGFVNESMLDSLKIVNGVAVAFIAMTAGGELDYRAMKPLLRTIRFISLYGVMGTALLLTVAVFLVRGALPFMDPLTGWEALAFSAVLGVVMVAQSPAVVVALRDELEADGIVSRTVLGVVVIADLLVILMFALVSSVAKAVLGGNVDAWHTVQDLAWELLGSLVAGAVIGYVLGLYLRKVAGGVGLFLLLVAFVIAEVGQRLDFDPLLVALAAGLFIRNATPMGDELHRHIETPAMPVYILFFAVAGANLHLDVLAVLGLPAALFVLVRGGGLLLGSRLGARAAGAEPAVQRHAGFGLLPQAGLALALALLVAELFPELGAEAGALTLGVVALNEIIAPILYRGALVRSGEVGKKPPSDSGPPAPGSEPLASSLSELGAAELGAAELGSLAPEGAVADQATTTSQRGDAATRGELESS